MLLPMPCPFVYWNCTRQRKLVIQIPWAPDSDEWIAAREKVQLREYQKAVDRLESLVVAQIDRKSVV